VVLAIIVISLLPMAIHALQSRSRAAAPMVGSLPIADETPQ
jgi:hypothetical protein